MIDVGEIGTCGRSTKVEPARAGGFASFRHTDGSGPVQNHTIVPSSSSYQFHFTHHCWRCYISNAVDTTCLTVRMPVPRILARTSLLPAIWVEIPTGIERDSLATRYAEAFKQSNQR